jgi:hypothetical protein
MTSRREHLRRIAHSSSDCPSRIDMTKTKRSNASSKRIGVKEVLSAHLAGPLRLMRDTSSAYSGAGMINWIACLITARRVQKRVQSMNPPIPSRHSPIAETRHCSALSWSAVRRNVRNKLPWKRSLFLISTGDIRPRRSSSHSDGSMSLAVDVKPASRTGGVAFPMKCLKRHRFAASSLVIVAATARRQKAPSAISGCVHG